MVSMCGSCRCGEYVWELLLWWVCVGVVIVVSMCGSCHYGEYVWELSLW